MPNLPPPPQGQTGVTLQALKGLPPPPSGQKGMTLDQIKQPQQNRSVAGFNVPSQPVNLADTLWGTIAGYGHAVKQAATQGADQARTAAGNINSGMPGNPIVNGLKQGLSLESGLASVVSSPLAPLMKPVSDGVNALGNASENLSEKVSNTLPGSKYQNFQQFANSKVGQATSDIAQPLADAGNVAGTILGADQAVKAAPKLIDSIKGIDYKGTNIPPAAAPEPPALNIEKVSDLYNRSIRPTVSGKATDAQNVRARGQAVSGLQSIADNKPNLTFTNADGEVTTGAAPKSVDQLSQAIGQTKQSIFKQYDALAQQAGEQGVTVDAPKIATELDPVINSKSLALANPSAIEYAKAIQERFNAAGKLDAPTAQDVIQHYNDSLKAFYRNPSYDTASKASIDALIANKLRTSLDEGISGATGEQYQALKNQYGALSSMEKDVTHRAIVWSRQNKVGLGANISNVASGAELVRGLLTMNPTDIAVSGAIKGIQKYVQYLNNPDVQISKIFSEIEKSGRSSTGSMSAPVEPEPISSASPEPTPTPTKSQPLTKGSVKIPGMDTAPGTSPESVASKMDDTDFHTLKQYLNNPSDLNVHMHADPIIQGMGIGKLPHAEQVSFLKEALDLYENNSTKTIKASEL